MEFLAQAFDVLLKQGILPAAFIIGSFAFFIALIGKIPLGNGHDIYPVPRFFLGLFGLIFSLAGIGGALWGVVALTTLPYPDPVSTPATQQIVSVTLPGTFQTVLGCSENWQPSNTCTAMYFNSISSIWQLSLHLLSGDYEYNVAINGDLGNRSNIQLKIPVNSDIQFYYDPITHYIADSINNIIVTAPGSYQNEIGCSGDWQPNCFRSWLQDPDTHGIYTFSTTAIPAGDYEVKVALNGTWDINYGLNAQRDGLNIPFHVLRDNMQVTFTYNSRTHILSVNTSG